MSLKAEKILCLVMLLVMAGYGVWGHFVLPEGPVAVHFGIDGRADGFAPRDQAMATLPVIALGLYVVLFWLAPALTQDKARLERAAGAYGAISLATMALMMALQIVLVLHAYGLPVKPLQTTLLGSGILLMIVGNYLPKARINHVVGIRTPWTLADEGVWDRTHRFSGPVFMLGGAAICAATFFVPQDALGIVSMVAWVVPVVVCLMYSWMIRKRGV